MGLTGQPIAFLGMPTYRGRVPSNGAEWTTHPEISSAHIANTPEQTPMWSADRFTSPTSFLT